MGKSTQARRIILHARPNFIKLSDIRKGNERGKETKDNKSSSMQTKRCRTDEVQLCTIASHYDTNGTYVYITLFFILIFINLLIKLFPELSDL